MINTIAMTKKRYFIIAFLFFLPFTVLAQAEKMDMASTPNSVVAEDKDISPIQTQEMKSKELKILFSEPKLLDAYEYLKIKDFKGANKIFDKIAVSEVDLPVKSEVRYWQGSIAMQDKNYKRAAELFLQGHQEGENTLFGVYNLYGLGVAMRSLDNKQDACKIMDKAAKIFGDENMVYPKLLHLRVQKFLAECGNSTS